MAKTYTWIGASGVGASGTIAADWTPSGGPPAAGDSEIINVNGTVLEGDGLLRSNIAILDGGRMTFAGDGLVTYAGPSLDAGSLITTATSPNSQSSSTIDALGNFVNQGTMLAAGAPGSTLTINVGTTVINGITAAGYFYNPGTIEANAGNSLTIAVGPSSEMLNAGSIIANGGKVRITVDPAAIAGGGAVRGQVFIEGGGTLETASAFGAAVTGSNQIYDFGDQTAGNTLKIDNIGSFSGRIDGFSTNDTIDLGASLSIGTVVFSTATNVLNLENNGGTVLASLLIATGAFASGTFAVNNGTADGFVLGNVVANGTTDTTLTTTLTTPIASNSSGSWQSPATWLNGVSPGPADTPFIGEGATSNFLVTTGTTAVSVGGIFLVSPQASLRITSNVTALPTGIVSRSGTIEVATGSTVTAASLSTTAPSASITIDSGASVHLTGHLNVELAPVGGTLEPNPGDNYANNFSAGTVVVNGALLAGPAPAGGGGGGTSIGYDSDGQPASVMVNAGGSVTDTRTLLGSDPTSSGSLILNGSGANWTDAIDHTDTAHTTGYIDVGYNDISSNTPSPLSPPGALAAAQLLIENGATMTEQEAAFIGDSANSSGTVTVSNGGFWNIANNGVGFLDVGQGGNGSLSVLNGGTVAIGNVGTFANNGTSFTGGGIGIAGSAGSSGTLTVSGAGALLTTQDGMAVGKAGQGILSIVNGGTVQVTGGGIGVGQTAATGSSGTITVGGTGAAALLNFGSGASGLTVGNQSPGTVVVSSGGTISMNGTSGIGLGRSAGVAGVMTVAGGVVNEGGTATGIGVGQTAGATGLLQVMNAGSVIVGGGSIGIGVTSSSASGTVSVQGANSVIRTTGTSSIIVGSSGNGVLLVSNGGLVSDNNGLFIGANAGAVGTVVVNAGTVTAATLIVDSTTAQVASGLLSIGAGGVVNVLTGNAVLNKSGYVTMSGGALSVPGTAAMNLSAGAELDGFGQVSNAGALNNLGTIVASGGRLELTSGGGAMGIAPGATLALDFGFSGTASFNGGTGVLALAAPGSASGTIAGFGAGDTISLGGVVNVSTVTVGANNVLTVSETGGEQLNLQLDPTQSYTGATFSAAVAGAATNITVSGVVASSPVAAAYTGILRTAPTSAQVSQTVAQIESGQSTLALYESGLIASDQALYTTLPALVSIDAYYNATPSAATLNAVAASTGSPSQIGGFYSAQYLHGLGYSDPNVWTIMASQWGADQSSQFYQLYNGFGTDYSGFISAVYQREFGFAPSASSLQTLVGDVPGVQALLAGGGGAATPIQVVSGIYGYLLYVGQTTPSLTTQYGTAANAFLRAAANGTANYGQELTQQFPAGTSTSGQAIGQAMADPNVITVTTPDQLIDPGAGDFTIRFQAGSGGDTLALHSGGVDRISGFDPGSDVLDLRALVSGTGLALTGDVAALSGYLTVADQGGDALLRFDPSGRGGGSAVAVLVGAGNSVTGLDQLIAHGAIRIS